MTFRSRKHSTPLISIVRIGNDASTRIDYSFPEFLSIILSRWKHQKYPTHSATERERLEIQTQDGNEAYKANRFSHNIRVDH